MRPFIPLLLFFSMAPMVLVAQKPYFPFFQQEYFFGHHPSARVEAMGRADVALGGTSSSLYYNPAGIGTIKDWQAMASTSGPFYLVGNSDFHFINYARRINKKWVAALTLNNLSIGNSTFLVRIGNERYEPDKPQVNDLILSVAYEPIKGLFIGANAHLFNWKIFDDVRTERSSYFDFGALYVVPINGSGKLQIGAGIINAFGSRIDFSAPDGANSFNWFPIVGRYGIAWTSQADRLPFPLDYTLTIETQNLFNSDFRSAFRMGGEAVVYDLLAVRLGWYTRTEDDMAAINNRSRFYDITYGFGIIVPLHEYFKGKFPFTVQLDYFSLRNPPLVFSTPRRANKRGFTLRVISYLSPNN